MVYFPHIRIKGGVQSKQRRIDLTRVLTSSKLCGKLGIKGLGTLCYPASV